MRTVKEAAKEALGWMILRSPDSVRRVLLSDFWYERFRYRHLQDLASQADICGFVADGEYGVIQGDITDRSIFPTYLRQKNWAPATNARFVHFLRDGGTYLDIGANIGLTTIPIARNSRVICVALEPTPINFRLLSANVAANCPHDNVTLHNTALFDRNTTVTLELSPKNSGDNRIRFNDKDGEMGETAWHIIEAPARKLDDLTAETRGPLAAKIDTQGAEPFIIAGGQQTLAAAGMLAIEFWPYGLSRMGGDPQIVVDFLRANFRKGLISVGDRDDYGEWQAIDAIAERLDELGHKAGKRSLGHLDVLVTK